MKTCSAILLAAALAAPAWADDSPASEEARDLQARGHSSPTRQRGTTCEPAVHEAAGAGAGSQAASDLEKVQASLQTWQKLKQQSGGDYSYTVRWSSFAGFGHETQVTVRDNKVVQRSFRSFNLRNPVPNEQPAAGESWVEKGEQLGSHKQGAPPKTLDELYAEAVGVAKMELADFQARYVRLDKQGLLLSCFVIDKRIADDAPQTGVAISSIELGGEKPSR